jgi:hypothetical protein
MEIGIGAANHTNYLLECRALEEKIPLVEGFVGLTARGA